MADSDDIVSVERVIPAPPEKIFDLLADPNRHQDIDGSGSVKAAKDNPERLSLGATFGMNMKIGLKYSMVSEVVEFEENRRIAWQSRPPSKLGSKLGGGRIWRYELEAVDGGTRVRESWDVSQEKGIKPIVKLGKKRTRTAIEKTLERIESIVTAPSAN